jgi:hypothetical protein
MRIILTVLSALRSVADARCPVEFFCPGGPVARCQSGGEGRGVVGWGGPDITDSVTNSCVDGEGEVAEDTHHRGNHDGMDNASALWGRDGLLWLPLLGRSTVLSDTFWMKEEVSRGVGAL